MKVLYEVGLDLPEGVGKAEMRDLILSSIRNLPGYYDIHNPIFRLNTKSVKVKYVKSNGLPISISKSRGIDYPGIGKISITRSTSIPFDGLDKDIVDLELTLKHILEDY